jgi:glutarate dioxygenase
MGTVVRPGSSTPRSGYRVAQHPLHPRLYHITLEGERLRSFFALLADVDVQNLEYVPYMRFMAAQRLETAFGEELIRTIRSILHDRESGGLTIGVGDATRQQHEYLKFATAVAHSIGPANFDAMAGTYYARVVVTHADDSDSYLRKAYRTLALHTDGTFVSEATDWLLMMKFEERNACGGESRLLHLDDWADLDAFRRHPLATYQFTYKSPPSKQVIETVRRQTFFTVNGRPCICFIDQFVYPDTIEQARYLHDLSQSLERAPAVTAVPLPVGQLILLNNAFWLHGRAAFDPHPQLYRELLRLRGIFSPA